MTYAKNNINPSETTFKDWAAKLQYIYPQENIPYPPEEANWHVWALFLQNIPRFEKAPMPHPQIYTRPEHWKNWASDFTNYLITSNL